MTGRDADVVRYFTEREPDEHGLGCVLLYVELDVAGVNTAPVPHVVYHSPTGLEYGYAGSGPADMALSILAHFMGCDAKALSAKMRDRAELDESERRAVHWHQDFKFKHVANANREAELVVQRGLVVRFVADQLEKERVRGEV